LHPLRRNPEPIRRLDTHQLARWPSILSVITARYADRVTESDGTVNVDHLTRVRARITGHVRPDAPIDLIRDVPGLDLGDSFRIGDDRVQIVSLTHHLTPEPVDPDAVSVDWVVEPVGA
jgi:hypothetical protein